MIYYDNPINYKNYKIEFKINEIIITNLKYINNKHIKYKIKLKLLLLHEYVKIKRKKRNDEMVNYIKYMINIPLHENIIQDIIKNISKEKEPNNLKFNSTINNNNEIIKYDNILHVDKNNKKINNKLRRKKYIMEYKNLCKVIKIKVIENPKNFKCSKCKVNNCSGYNKIKNNICKFIDYDKNKLYNKEQISFIIAELMKIINIIKNQYVDGIDNIKIYVFHLLNCMKKDNYQNPLFISLKNKLLKEIE